jgi:hypothetical protein
VYAYYLQTGKVNLVPPPKDDYGDYKVLLAMGVIAVCLSLVCGLVLDSIGVMASRADMKKIVGLITSETYLVGIFLLHR